MKPWREIELTGCARLKRGRIDLATKLIATDQFVLVGIGHNVASKKYPPWGGLRRSLSIKAAVQT